MTFNEVMALIMPSIISLLFYSKTVNNKMTVFGLIGTFTLFTLITNCIIYAILTLLKTSPIIFSVSFTLKYSILATVISLLVAIIYRLVEMNIKIKLKVEPRNEKD